MIFQGIYNIIDLYITEIDLFYNSIDNYFRKRFDQAQLFKSYFREKTKFGIENELREILDFIINELEQLGFEKNEVSIKFSAQNLELDLTNMERFNSGMEVYKTKFAPIVYEIFLESISKYLADINAENSLENLNIENLLPLEFIIKLQQLKELIKENPEKLESLKKYIKIYDKIFQKFLENKKTIESFEDLDDKIEKIQLSYIIFRLIDFFRITESFDFSHLKIYLRDNIDEWLDVLPLITLRNPDLHYCGIYLSSKLDVEVDKNKINNFLLNLYDNIINEFEAPIIQATYQVYYLLKSTSHMNLLLSNEQLRKILDSNDEFFASSYLENLETSQLGVILKLYFFLGTSAYQDDNRINVIIDEIDRRISTYGIQQFRNGLITSEATYYVLFGNYMMNSLDKLKDFNILESILSRIYQNLELIQFSKDMNFDIISELFYSCESLKVLNYVETKQTRDCLTALLFPEEIKNQLDKKDIIVRDNVRLRHLKVNRITGETIY